jgi:hypothetical protein
MVNTSAAMSDTLGQMLAWLKSLDWPWLVALTLGMAALSLLVVVLVVVRWPVDHFKEGVRPFWTGRHPLVRALGLGAKNVLGWLVVILGIVLSLPGVPGQGLLLILIGLTLVDFPGKNRLERRLIGRPAVLKAINGVRARFGHPPLVIE